MTDGPSGARLEAVLVDLDGTVVRGGTLVDGAAEGLAAVRAAGLEVLFLTNNPTRTAAELAAHLRDLGVAADPSEVLTSATATLGYLRRHHEGAAMLPLLGDAVLAQLREAPLTVVDEPGAADVVVAGYDEGFDYGDLTRGLRALRAGASLVGTDPDRWVPTDEGPIPGSGAVINAVAGAAEVEPEAVLGKPSAETVELALDRVGADPGECLLVGDRLDTDVAMGERAGMETALVLTGAADRADLEGSAVRPDHAVGSLADVADLL